MKGKVEDWATESLLARGKPIRCPRPASVSSLARDLATPICKRTCRSCGERLYQSGVRLAMVLNEAFGE